MAFLFVTSGTTTGFQSNTGTSTFDAIAGGGGGAAGSTGGGTQASAGGGGAWAQNTAITWTQSQNCAIGGGGAGGTAQGSGSISSAQNGANGTKSWCRTDNGAASIPTTSGQGVAADLGVGGSINPTTT